MSSNGYSKLVEEVGTPSYGSYSAREANEAARKPSAEKSRLMGQVQNVKSKNVYVFSDGTVADTDTQNDTIELGTMTRRSNHQRTYKSTGSTQYDDIITKEIPLQKTDTLQGLSIKFRCPVPEIKRINGLYTDQEFYALTSIKIPVRSHQSILQRELDEVAKERMTAPDDLLKSKVKCAADIVSSQETSEDEEQCSAAGRQSSLMDMVELHSDPDDQESYALLDRDWPTKKQKHLKDHNKRDRRKFDKILNRKDEEFRVLAEKVQKQAEAVDSVTAFMNVPNLGPPQPRPRNCLSTMVLSLPCLIIAFFVIFGGLPTLIYFQYFYGHNHGKPPTPPAH